MTLEMAQEAIVVAALAHARTQESAISGIEAAGAKANPGA